MIVSYKGKKPAIASNVFVAPSAQIIGNVNIGEEATIWFNAVLRGDEGRSPLVKDVTSKTIQRFIYMKELLSL